ncbi:TPA: CDP-alcohol phosphatidyltransferase family protein [Enterobacter hormaechei subsp. xiangfangensis]|nr:CDP-alcohol phosphatidyltransferase family protein [Enterobacter hormaechei subsp. xiangfangensis]
MFDRYLLKKSSNIREVCAVTLQRRGVKADWISWFGFGIGMMAVPLLIAHAYYWALLCIVFNRMADLLDGAVARLDGPTDRGAFLDITLDFLFYSAIPLGFALAMPANNALPAAILIYSFIGTGCSFLAFAVIAAKRGMESTAYPSKGFYYLGGLTEGSETVLVLLLMCLFPGWFPLIAYGFSALCCITVVTRVVAGVSLFKNDYGTVKQTGADI